MAVDSLKVFLKVSKSPKSALICLAMSPVGWPPMPDELAGPMMLQNMVWLEWPPPLLRTAARISSGTSVEIGDQVVDRLGGQRRVVGQGGVHVVDVGLVVLVVVQMHGFGVDEGFERVVVVGKRR